MGGFAWITLATNDPYCLGALVLAHSLKRVGTKYDIAILITPGVTSAMREKLNTVFSIVQEVNVLDSKDETNLALLARPELGVTFTKLHCWKMTMYEKCIFVDADALVIRNCDELFERDELSAAPDVGWPDCFNSGVFVFKPSQQTFESLTAFAETKGSFDGGDQGLLNQYFSDWAHKDISKHLPFIYNMCSTATYSYLPAYKQYGSDVRIIHFIGSTKPWLQYFDTQTGQVHPSSESAHLQSLLQHWWNIFCEMVHPQLSSVMLSNDHRDANYFEARSTLAPIWHDSHPHISTTDFILNNYAFHNPTDLTYNQVDKPQSDFSEFHDPWDNYIENNDNNVIDKNINQTNSIIDEENDFHSNINSICQLNNITNLIHEKHGNDFNNCINNEIIDNQEYNEHIESLCNNFVKFDYVRTPQLHSEIHQLDDCSNLQYISDDNYPTNLLSENDSSIYTTYQHYEHDNSQSDTHCHQPQCNNQFNNNIKILLLNEDDHNCQNNISCTDTHAIKSQTQSHTCTEPKSIACESHSNSFNEIAHDNTGIAGALAKITLGTPRSPEQEAFEEHMRKQSWEQGKIDYMGRDSFDNIWTKICSTISIATDFESTPLDNKITAKDNQTTAETASTIHTKVPLATSQTVSSLLQKQDVMEKIRSHETVESNVPHCPSQMPVIEKSNKSHVIEPNVSPTIGSFNTPYDMIQGNPEHLLAITCSTSSSRLKESNEDCKEINTDVPHTKPHKQEDTFMTESTAIPLSFSSEIAPGVSAITSNQEKIKTLDESVSIQVAESILEADIKESVTEDIKPVTEEAISSISAPIQESIFTVVETPLEPPAPVHSQFVEELPPAQTNGDTLDFNEQPNEFRVIRAIPTSSATIPPAVTESVFAPMPPSDPTLENLVETKDKEVEKIASQDEKIFSSPLTSDNTQMVEPTTSSTDFPIESSSEVHEQTLEPPVTDNSPDKIEDPIEKPMSSIQLGIPTTPIVTEATPPTTPPFNVTVNLDEGVKPTKKIVKKSTKKSSQEEKTDGNDINEGQKIKKKIKKGVSGVLKKDKESKELSEENPETSSADKTKKIIKVKKSTKSAQCLETDASIPDTPPPPSPQAAATAAVAAASSSSPSPPSSSSSSSEKPVPPKRKVKPSTTKISINKPESES